MMLRGAAKLRDSVVAEDAIRHSALQAAGPEPRTTAEATRHALSLKATAEDKQPPPADAAWTRRDPLAARLRAGAAVNAPGPASTAGLLRTWAQGP